jgi:glycosyltransferase involved in cell wall biosynthesis
MVSRLDAPKRIDMLIRAMQYVTSDVKLLIAGRGPEREHLEKLAGNDSRIQFLGFVNDEEVEEYYANSLVIPYFPYDEDYGLITIEAMLHKKPVITTKDAGGPTEFVQDDETGYVVEFEEHAIAEKIDYFAQHPQEAQRMGENAYRAVRDITWTSVAEPLLACLKEADSKSGRKRIVVTSSFGITPPQGGGQARIFNVYKNVAKDYDVEIVSFAGYGNPGLSEYIAEGLKETRIPMSQEHFDAEMEIQKKMGSVPISDIAMIENAEKTLEYDRALQQALSGCDMAVISHPYLYFEAKKHLKDIPFVYEAHNVEYNMKKAVLPDNQTGRELLQLVYNVEKECCVDSAFIMTCSEEDREKLCELYGVSLDKIIVVPNGVDASRTKFVPIEKRLENKRSAGVKQEKLGLFMGSWHGPNLEACEKIFDIAKQCPDVIFLLMGSQCSYFQQRREQYDIPKNVGMLGLVSEDEKLKVFNTVDFALNPMLSGSGTNLKMFDYMSAGIPVITTSFGTRGIQDTSGLIIAEIEEMPEAIRRLELNQQEELIDSARRTVEQEFDWKVIVRPLLEQLGKLG